MECTNGEYAMGAMNNLCPVCGYYLGFPAWQGLRHLMKFVLAAVFIMDTMMLLAAMLINAIQFINHEEIFG